MDNSKFPFEKEKLDAGTGPAEADAGSVTEYVCDAGFPKDTDLDRRPAGRASEAEDAGSRASCRCRRVQRRLLSRRSSLR